MPEKPSPLLPDDEQSRDRLRAVLAVFCVLAVVLAGTVVPAVSGAGLGQTPLGSVVPTPNVNVGGAGGGGGTGGAGGGLGALNPGERTSLGGSLAENGSAFRSQNAEVHFRVRSTTASYWRTGAYDSYTGSGWKQSGDRRPYAGPIEGAGIQGQRVEYSVTLGQSATALPSVWRANSVSAAGSESFADSLYVTDQRAFVTGDPVPAGTTYSGVSHRPPRDPTVLQTAGRDYPSDVERRYTALPEETDPRLGEFTERLTDDADSPYETAARVESWLEANKNYSLNVSKPAGEDVASQFVFEMEKGYCEYFATAMTVMLRSQGVPARYVVGYSTGQKVGVNTYKVRAMNAHAWVEVYFPDVGWVRFDPTPGQARLQSERRAFRNQTGNSLRDYNHRESGSPGERFSPTNSESEISGPATATTSDSTADAETPSGSGTGTPGTETPTDSGTTTEGAGDSTDLGTTTAAPGETTRETTARDSRDRSDSGTSGRYEVELNRTPVPGATVEVTVRSYGSVAVGVPVFFNGERVGVTDGEGTVVGQVPYAERLKIEVGDGGGASDDDTDGSDSAAALSEPQIESSKKYFQILNNYEIMSVPALDSGATFSLAGPPPTGSVPLPADSPPSAARPRGGLAAPDSIRQRAPGNQTNGTDYSLATNATLAVSGDVTAGNEVVVTATVRGVPVRNAEITLGNRTVATTGANGRARVRLPDSPGNVTLGVSRGPVEGETTLTVPRLEVSTDPELPLALPGTSLEICATYGGDPLSNAQVRVAGRNLTTDINGTATAALPFRGSAAVVVSARGQTRRTTVSGLFVNLAGVLGGALLVLGGLGFAAYRRGIGPRRILALLAGGIRAIPDLAVAALFGAADRLSWALETLLDALAELRAGETTVGELLDRFRAWLADRLEAVRESGRRSLAGLGGVESKPDAQTGEGDPDDSYRTLREAWDAFLRTVSVRRPDAMTPGELADHAVREDDLPPGAVLTLRDAFRDVEYGARSPDDRLPRVEEAVEAIERAHRDGDERAASAGAPDATGGPDAVGGDD